MGDSASTRHRAEANSSLLFRAPQEQHLTSRSQDDVDMFPPLTENLHVGQPHGLEDSQAVLGHESGVLSSVANDALREAAPLRSTSMDTVDKVFLRHLAENEYGP